MSAITSAGITCSPNRARNRAPKSGKVGFFLGASPAGTKLATILRRRVMATSWPALTQARTLGNAVRNHLVSQFSGVKSPPPSPAAMTPSTGNPGHACLRLQTAKPGPVFRLPERSRTGACSASPVALCAVPPPPRSAQHFGRVGREWLVIERRTTPRPCIKPDGRFSRIRLSEVVHRLAIGGAAHTRGG